jgi:ubiquitin carboxyl-terminal hydrolase 8
MAIYDNEFTKNLRRQPVLLKGGWEAWERVIGEKGILRDRPLDQLRSDENERTDEFGVLEARKASNRRTSIMSLNGPGSAPILRNPSDHVS